MVTEWIVGNIHQTEVKKEIVLVEFEWFELEKKRIKKVASDGENIGIAIDEVLSDGDILAETEEKVYVVKVLPTKLLKVVVKGMEEMGRACFELGNRHLSPKISHDSVMVVYDEPTFLYMKKLGFTVDCVEEVFTDYIVCKAHGHSEGHDHDSHEHSHEAHEHHHNHDHASHEHHHGDHHE